MTTTQSRIPAEEYAARSKRCWACEKALDDPSLAFCHGCGEFFCGGFTCPATDHELTVPWGGHEPEAHLGSDDEDEDQDDR